MQNDKALYVNAFYSPNPSVTGTSTTWNGHADDLRGRLANIAAMISLGQKMGCDMSLEAALASTLFVPTAPGVRGMRIRIDFSIFESPICAYGNVTGVLEVASTPDIGALVPFIGKQGLIVAEGFTGVLRVISMISLDDGSSVIGLDDVVLTTRASAELLARRLENEMDLFVAEYHPR